jgi:hypothetical protein
VPDEPKDDEAPKPAPIPEAAAPSDEPADEKPAGEKPEDRFRPEAIAARIDAIGAETELERVERDEEKKLLERKKAQKKRGLEAAASKRLAKIGEGNVKRPSALRDNMAPDADPVVDLATRVSSWVKENRQTFGAVVTVAALAAAGFAGWTYWQEKRNAEASVVLAQALADQHGTISDKDDDEDDDTKAKPLYPSFKTAADRREAALAKYRLVESKFSGTGAAMLARLAEGSLLLDAGDAKGAVTAFDDVRNSPLGQADAEVRGRALEGTGFANELLATTDAGGKDKHLDDALAAFQKLENVEIDGYRELGKFHQARVLQAKGDKAKAVELLKDVQKRVSEPGETHPFSYLQFVVEDRLRELDPSALPPKAPRMPPGAGGTPGVAPGGKGLDMNDPQIQKLLEQLKHQKQGGGPPAPILPPMPGNAPAPPGNAPPPAPASSP